MPDISELFTLSTEMVFDTIELPPVKYYRVGQRGDIISRSGKIVSLWNSWHSKWMVWYAPEQVEPVKVSPSKFIRRFQGNNRGRHFDRKFKP
jgi:hypothetical protein